MKMRPYDLCEQKQFGKGHCLIGDSVPKPLGFAAFPPEWLFCLGRLEPPRHSGRWVGARGCGRDGHRCPPPAQIRTGGITAYGSSLGYERRSVRRDMDEECGDEESTGRR
jgi:hypothetical protein